MKNVGDEDTLLIDLIPLGKEDFADGKLDEEWVGGRFN